MESSTQRLSSEIVSYLVLGVAAAWLAPATFAAEAPPLTADERTFLDELIDEVLFDPKGAERALVPMNGYEHIMSDVMNVDVVCWLKRNEAGAPSEAYRFDRHAVPVSEPLKISKTVDFVAECLGLYQNVDPAKAVGAADEAPRHAYFPEIKPPGMQRSHLANAAWLHRLGHDDLAARAFAAAIENELYSGSLESYLRSELAWTAYEGLFLSFVHRADDDAVAFGKHLLQTYSDEAQKFPQAELILADLERRRAKGTFGRSRTPELPTEFYQWDAAKQTAFLVDGLDEIDAASFNRGQIRHRYAAALIALGEQAVPALTDAVERDRRLTRLRHFPGESGHFHVQPVAEPALAAAKAILQTDQLDVRTRGELRAGNSDVHFEQAARDLRDYWTEYGGLPFDERMMKILTDPTTSFTAKREAATNLTGAKLNPYEDRLHVRRQATERDPAVGKFSRPTTAEAILAAYDADAASPRDPQPLDSYDPNRMKEERRRTDVYIAALRELGDRRIVGDCARRSIGSATPRERRLWAFLARQLGDPEPLNRLAIAVRSGTQPLSPTPEPESDADPEERREELREMISVLVAARTPAAEQALMSLAAPTHPYWKAVQEIILIDNVSYLGRNVGWSEHSFCLSVLRQTLDDVTLTGEVRTIERDFQIGRKPNHNSETFIPRSLLDERVRRNRAEVRRCDLAAEQLAYLVAGFRLYSPLLRDADGRIAEMKVGFDRFGKRYRRTTQTEAVVFGTSSWDARFIPDIAPLARGATVDDVRNGKAIFHLEPPGKPVNLQLPAVAVFSPIRADEPGEALIVQAEVTADGKTVYGVVERHAVQMISADEIRRVITLEQYQWEQSPERKQVMQLLYLDGRNSE